MAHRDLHPEPVSDCFGCKVAGIGYDGGHRTQVTTDANRATIVQHRDGRQDVTVRPRTVRLVARMEG
jgi:hypothetical protein